MSIAILVADDHKVVRDGIRVMLRYRPDLKIVAEASCYADTLFMVRREKLDLILLDISMPGGGIKLFQQLLSEGCDVPVLFFSMHPAEQYASYLNELGANGFLGKDASAAEIISVIDKILSGKKHFPTLSHQEISGTSEAIESRLSRLSAREREVMFGLLTGKSQVDIAKELGITNKSVGTYRLRILNKLGVSSNTELVTLSMRLGLL